MSRGRLVLVATLLAAAVLAVVLLLPTAGEAAQRPSVVSRSARGMRAAFHYLEARGAPVEAWTKPLSELPAEPGVLVIACPIAAPFSDDDAEAVRSWLLRGGSLVLLPSGERPDPREIGLFLAHELYHARSGEPPPLSWGAWRRWKLAVERLRPGDVAEEGEAHAAEVVVLRGTHGVLLPGGARVLLRDEQRGAAVFEDARGRGRLLVVNNATAWGNAWIAEAGNAEHVEASLTRLLPPGGRILFDEWHQGVRDAAAAVSDAVVTPFELLVAHAALIYLAAVWALSRRFGPRRPPEPERGRPGAADFVALAELHRRSGHAREAGERMLAMARRRARRGGQAGARLPAAFEGGPRELRELARTIGTMQREHELVGG